MITTGQRAGLYRIVSAGRIFASAALCLAVAMLPASADLIAAAKDHVAEKHRLGGARYAGGGFSLGAVYELKGRLGGVIASADGCTIDIEIGERSLHLLIPALPKGISSGAVVRALVRARPDDGALEPLSLVLDREAAVLDPDPEPSPQEPDNAASAPNPERPKPSLDPNWHAYLTQLIRYFNPRLDADQAQRIAYNILYQSNRWRVDPLLTVAVIAAESNFDPSAQSRKGAMGLSQIMPGTAKSLGLTNPFNVEQNIYAGVRTIRGHLERNNTGDPWQQFALALACYNAGSGAVRKYGGVPPYNETRRYIERVYHIYRALYESIGG